MRITKLTESGREEKCRQRKRKKERNWEDDVR